jgi:hypothetical protein
MQANEDDVYSHEVARRSVARAALHLGLDSMSEEALDVLGDVLLTYLQRVSVSRVFVASNACGQGTLMSRLSLERPCLLW